MNRNFYYGFFKYLYDIYDISEWTAIDQYVLPHIREAQKLVDTIHVKAMLDDLEDKKIIEWKADKITTNADGVTSTHWQDIPKYKGDFGKDENHTFDNTRIEVKLTRDVGLNYAAELVNSHAIRDSTLSTNKWMKYLTAILAGAAFFTLVVQIVQCNISRKQFVQGQIEVGHSKETLSPLLDDSTKTKRDTTTANNPN